MCREYDNAVVTVTTPLELGQLHCLANVTVSMQVAVETVCGQWPRGKRSAAADVGPPRDVKVRTLRYGIHDSRSDDLVPSACVFPSPCTYILLIPTRDQSS